MLGARECKAASGTLAVSNLQPIVEEIFQISRFHFVTSIFATTEEALAKFTL
jgi:anti-anti-sigma regulatory factor